VKRDTPEWIEKISKKRKCFVLVDKNKVVGYLALKRNEISKFFIHPYYPRKGYGRKLMDKAPSTMKKTGAKNIKLYSNLGAKGFYSKCGFDLIKNIKKDGCLLFQIKIYCKNTKNWALPPRESGC
jgi:N-acetylglutamate synthase-like GNAT family acetyltransferase